MLWWSSLSQLVSNHPPPPPSQVEPSVDQCDPQISPKLPLPLPPFPPRMIQSPIIFIIFVICYHFLIIIYHLPHHSLDPLPPRMIQSAIMNHPPRRSRYPCHIFLAKTTTAQRRTFKKELPRKYLQWNIKLWPVVPECHIRFISTWFSAYITHRLHNVFDRSCKYSSSSRVRMSIKRWNCGIGIFHSIGSFPDLTTN